MARRRIDLRAAFLAAAGLGWSMSAFAQTKAADTNETIVVTGKSLEETQPQELSGLGHDLVTVDATAIRNAGAVDLTAALQSVPGLYIRSQSGPFSYADLSLQGSRSQDVLWTWDGIRLNNRLYGTTLSTDTLPASMIERIEVLKGGESLFYGTQAAGGVINVVTRGFSNTFDGQLNASVDTFGGNAVDGFARGAIGDHRFVAYATHNQSPGFQPFSRMEPSATDRNRGYDLWSAGLKYQFELAPDLTLNAFWQHTEGKIDNLSATRVNESRNDRNEEIGSVWLDYTRNDTVQLFLKGYFHDWKTAYVQILNPVPAGPPITVYPSGTFWGYRDYGGTAIAKLHLHRYVEYLVGYDYQRFSGRDDVLRIAPTDEQVHAGIFQLRTNDELSKNGRLAAGVRYNKSRGAQKTVWNASGRYDFADAVYFEANGGTSFVLPDASQLYGIDPCCEIGNPRLNPEESLSVNISAGGHAATGTGMLRWKATYFKRRITNLIDTVYDDPAFPNGTYGNVARRVHSHGVDLELGASLAGGWTLAANYTRARLRERGSEVQRDRSPEQFARGSIAWTPERLPVGANVSVNWVGNVYSTLPSYGRRNYGNYAVVDTGVHLYPDAARKHRLGINVENVFNKDYASVGYRRTVSDAGRRDGTMSPFLYYFRGVPRTLRASYGVAF